MNTNDRIDQALDYAGLLAEICKLTGRPDRNVEQKVFERLGWETTYNKRGYCIRRPGESHWQSQPHILSDFGTAVAYTIGHRYGGLEHRLETNWYISQMCETAETVDMTGPRIAAWAVRIAKMSKTSQDATAITPAAALVAAWLRAHP